MKRKRPLREGDAVLPKKSSPIGEGRPRIVQRDDHGLWVPWRTNQEKFRDITRRNFVKCGPESKTPESA